MTTMSKKYRIAYVVHNSGHDFSPLLDVCTSIRFCATGYERGDEIVPTMAKSLADFDPNVDVLVPVGNVGLNCVAGAILQQVTGGTFYMAIFQEKEYHITQVTIQPTSEVT